MNQQKETDNIQSAVTIFDEADDEVLEKEESSKLEDIDFDDTDMTDVNLVCSDEALQMVSTMLKLQDEANVKFIGEDWKSKARFHEKWDYIPTMFAEAAELFGSAPEWKFWKAASAPDIQNCQLEFIDILHFAMSEAMATSDNMETLTRSLGFWMDIEFGQATPTWNFQYLKRSLLIFLASTVQGYGLSEGNDLDWSSFWQIAVNTGMTKEQVYLYYCGKVSLNLLRIVNDDKGGNYSRLWWNEKEDNYFMMSSLEEMAILIAKGEFSVPTQESLFNWLSHNYDRFRTNREFMPLKVWVA